MARPYPGIPTDVQAQFTALACLAPGLSTVGDQVFAHRFRHVAELNRLGARIEWSDSTATIQGVDRLTGATVTASDLRASAALVLAGLAAEGHTVVRRIRHLDRGYQRLDEKLNRLGTDRTQHVTRNTSGVVIHADGDFPCATASQSSEFPASSALLC